ncbi:MAG: FMN-binding negative transcriptional regulator [Alphaproteobacteria bacterium]|nr:FMN-binding negative transcriptional regulator [Alphaproteobacteria bacterium]
MYAHPAFRVTDDDELASFVDARRFATLVTGGVDGVQAAHLPMKLERSGNGGAYLEGHIARANPMLATISNGIPALAIFQGADAYVTPSLYQSKRENGRVVPTWNYIAVHVSGTLDLFEEASDLRAHISRLTDMMEAGSAAPWEVSDAPGDYIEGMVRAIIGVRLRITTMEGIRKLSQNRSEADRAGVHHGFSHSSDGGARALADEMTSDPATTTETSAQ